MKKSKFGKTKWKFKKQDEVLPKSERENIKIMYMIADICLIWLVDKT